jgi:hypothetical protein
MTMRASMVAVLLIVSCKGMIVEAPGRPKDAPEPPPTPPAVEAAKMPSCSPQSHFGTKEASDMLKFPMRWESEEPTNCNMVPPSDTHPYFVASVMDGAQFFDNFTQEAGAERDRDAVPRAQHVAWLPKSYTMVTEDGSRVVVVQMRPGNGPPPSQTDARMQAGVIASKLLAYF